MNRRTQERRGRVVVFLTQDFADAANREGFEQTTATELEPLKRILRESKAAISFSQENEFRFHLESAESHGVADDPFRAFTRQALERSSAYLAGRFGVAVSGQRLYRLSVARKLETELKPLIDGAVVNAVRVEREGDGPRVPEALFRRAEVGVVRG